MGRFVNRFGPAAAQKVAQKSRLPCRVWILIWGIPLYVRRMRDAGYSGWMVLVAMIVIGVVNTIDPTGKVGSLLSIGLMVFLLCAPSKY